MPSPPPEATSHTNGNGRAKSGLFPVNRLGVEPGPTAPRRGRPQTRVADSAPSTGSLAERIYDTIAAHGPKTPERLATLLGTTARGITMTVAKNLDKFRPDLDGQGRVCLRLEA